MIGAATRFREIDMTGQVLGRLTVLERRAGGNGATWLCRCDCGRTCVELGTALRRRASKPSRSYLLACPECRRSASLAKRVEARAAKPREELVHRCSECRQPGHNSATCPTLQVRRGHPSFVDMTGVRVGRLLVIERAPNSSRGLARWRCRCDCGMATERNGIELRAGLKAGQDLRCPECGPKTGTKRKAIPPSLARVDPAIGTPRKPGQTCRVCWGLARGVPGPKCPGCGRLAEEGK